MSQFVTDTHAIYWHLTTDRRLSPAAQRVFLDADAGLHQILVPGIALIEMVYLVEKGHLDESLVTQLFALLDVPGGSYAVAPLNPGTATALRAVPWSAVPDMPDRIIAATAHQYGLPLISRDSRIRRANIVPVIW